MSHTTGATNPLPIARVVIKSHRVMSGARASAPGPIVQRIVTEL